MKFEYAGWTDAASQNLTDKEAQKLAKQLKSYVNSSKFIQQGSKVNKINDQGALTKVPIKNVIYYTSADAQNPISAQQLDDLIHTAVITKEPELLSRVSKYRFYTGQPVVSKKQLLEAKQDQYRKRLTRNSTILGLALSTTGASIPIIYRKAEDKSINKDTLKGAALLALTGLASGITIAGFTTKK